MPSGFILLWLQSLTATGITICATIHSPSPRTFELFERCVPAWALWHGFLHEHWILLVSDICWAMYFEQSSCLSTLNATGMMTCRICRVFILQRGRVVYFGDNGDAATAYFTQTLPEVRLFPSVGVVVPLVTAHFSSWRSSRFEASTSSQQLLLGSHMGELL